MSVAMKIRHDKPNRRLLIWRDDQRQPKPKVQFKKKTASSIVPAVERFQGL
jgi:hypothetical protein